MDMANVSLYEHLKTTAAFADCFFLYREENPSAFRWDGTRISLAQDVRPVILLGGDISGIQNFIYNISSRKAAVSLKGRSFYLQLLVDSVIQRIISHPDIDATAAQVVYSSGGKFYMLLPNTRKVLDAVDELRREFELKLWEEHRGALLMNIDYVPFAFDAKSKKFSFAETGSDSGIGELWRTLADKLTSRRNTRFLSVVRSGRLFSPEPVSPDAKVCAVTGIEGNCVNIGGSGDDAVWVLPGVRKQCDLGKVLKDADYIITYSRDTDPKFIGNRAKFDIEIMGVHSYLFDKKELAVDNSEFRGISSADVCRVKSINNLIVPQIKGKACSYGFQFYGGNLQAFDTNGENKTFEELADGEYLGILRMDVDSLGAIFINGLPETGRSFAAYSTLSFMLDWFFSGYLNTIRNQSRFKDYVDILYSGGDDVFAVGKWDRLILFAEEVRRCFEKFTGRPDISISAGLVMINDKYPISKAALLSGDAESAAKSFLRDGLPKKNAINLFGENLSWKDEFETVRMRKSEFVELVANENMPRSILHRLMILYQKKCEGHMSYIWHTEYFLKRFSAGKTDAVKAFCSKLKTELCDGRRYELNAVAARWAELELRFNNTK